MKLIHISVDEKFIDGAIDIYNYMKGVDSVYFVLSPNGSIKRIKYPKVVVFKSENELIQKVNQETCDYVVLHSLCLTYKSILRINHKLIWNSWGYDIYSDTQDTYDKVLSLSMYKPASRKVVEAIDGGSLKENVIKAIRRVKHKLVEQRLYNAIMRKVSFVSTVIPSEFDLIQKKYSHIGFCPFRYIDNLTESEDVALVCDNDAGSAKRIILGNSNDPTNNHLDILEKLDSIGREYEVIVPFSYPNNSPQYVQEVLNRSGDFKNLKIRFLRDFMALEEYFKILKSCQSAIFGHVRQQAVGNVSYMFNSGKNVFLYGDSILYTFYKKQGYKVYSIENELNAECIENTLPLDEQKINNQKNRERHDYFGLIAELQRFYDGLQN